MNVKTQLNLNLINLLRNVTKQFKLDKPLNVNIEIYAIVIILTSQIQLS